MPPKKKGNGKDKGRKGVTSTAEPSQPLPDAPYCLALVLEVCLDVVKRVVQVEPGAADNSTHEPDGGGEANAAGYRTLLVEPFFRYTFINGDKVVTPTIGLPGSPWTMNRPASSDNAAPGSAPAPVEAETTAPGEKQELESEQAAPVVWRYRRFHQLQGTCDEEVALALDRRAIIQVTLADKSSDKATTQPTGPGAAEGGDIKSSSKADVGGVETNFTGRNFIESWPLDLSAFLSGETCVAISLGRVCGRSDITSTKRSSRAGQLSMHVENCAAIDFLGDMSGSPSRAPPAPEGIRFMRISVSLARAVVATEETAQVLGERGPGSWSESSNADSKNSGKGLFSHEGIADLNPLSVKVTSAASLPGVRTDAESLQHHVRPSNFKLLQTHCKPVYVVCRPFPDDPPSGSLHHRIVWTAGSAQCDEAHFNHTTTFLVGAMDRHRLEEWAEHSMLTVEIHDRDALPSSTERMEKAIRLERMVAGGYPIEQSHPSSGVALSTTVKAYKESTDAEDEDEVPLIKYSTPRDIFEVDEIALEEAIASAEASGKDNAHGVASFRLSGLLDQSCQLISAYNKNRLEKGGVMPSTSPAISEMKINPRLKLRSDICPSKRREIPKGGVQDWHLSDEERLVRLPGAYLDTGASLGIRLVLARPLRTLQEGSAEGTGPATEEPRPFMRAVFVVEYEEGGALVREVTAAMDQINGQALKYIQGSLRAYRLTLEEKNAVDDGALDIVCGFMVIDEDSRTIVLEGTGGADGGLTNLLRMVGRARPNGRAYRALEDPRVRFSKRLYTSFNTDLKKVRLRDPLPVLCTSPEIYNRSKVSTDCFSALQRLRMLRKADRMREAAEYALLPGAQQLLEKVESQYGESVSIKDITGREPFKKSQAETANKEPPREPSEIESISRVGDGDIAATKTKAEGEVEIRTKKQASAKRKAPTDSSNAAFDEWLKDRKPRDVLLEQVLSKPRGESVAKISAKVHDDFIEREKRRRKGIEDETVPTDWCYGPQALNYIELKKAEMRERLAKDKGATYTYSVDYVSQTVSLVDEWRIKEAEKAKSKAAWKTKRGFRWPYPSTRQEFITHPRKPSESRIELLKEPWVENQLSGGTVEDPAGGRKEVCPPPELAWRRKFDTSTFNGKTVFGGLQMPKYERTINTAMIGSRSKLPRGRQQLKKDPDFFRSVHIVSDGVPREEAEALSRRKEEEQWQSKVVVDDINFRVGKLNVRDTPLQVDRTKDILHPPINKIAFKIVRNARLPSGRRVPLSPPPISALSLEPYEEHGSVKNSFRGNHCEGWTATDPVTGEKLDFCLRLHQDRMKPKPHKACARMKHPPLTQSEMRGPRWETGRVARTARLVSEEDST